MADYEKVKQGCADNGITLVTQTVNTTAEVKQAAQSIVNRVDGIYLTTDNNVFSAVSAVIQGFGDA